MTGIPEDLRRRAETWLAQDPDPDTRAELAALLDAGDGAGVAERFGAPLRFGTAGIRGPLGAGPARMNCLVVRALTAGVAAWLRAQGEERLYRGVVVGHDARWKSAEFADDAARVLAGAGIPVQRFELPVPTPLVAFAVRSLGAIGGVQITASHNPAADNGYKLYVEGGAQVVPPADDEIAAAVEAVGAPSDVQLAVDDHLIATVPDAIVEAYLDAGLALLEHAEQRRLRIVYTPLHGVAASLLTELLGRAGFDDVRVVPEQALPDAAFPTVDFPNPEEPGVLGRALALARAVDADLVLANDPDGDRIAVAVPEPDPPWFDPDVDGDISPEGSQSWRVLSGDETGCLLARHLLARGPRDRRFVATTVVSSRLLSKIAAAYGARYGETLTGFKWLAQAAEDAAADGYRLVIAYEQALGVMLGDAVRDKDGITAALVLADIAARLKEQGTTIAEAENAVAQWEGVHATAGRSLRLEGPEGEGLVKHTLQRLREDPPTRIGGQEVVMVADYGAGTRTDRDGKVTPTGIPSAELIEFGLGDGSRLLVRPSGTEPLLKFYAEVIDWKPDDPAWVMRRRAQGRLQELLQEFIGLAVPST